MIRDVKLNYIIFRILLLVCFLANTNLCVQAMPTRLTQQDDKGGTCKIKVLKSTGEIQTGVYAKIFANIKEFEQDENGIITVSYTSNTYTHAVTLYFQGESEKCQKRIKLDTENNKMTVYFDRIQDIQQYKQTTRLFPIEGVVVDEQGNPLERATVSIQGTGRRTLTDEMGLFQIDADFNHNVVIRADGMKNLSLPISHFFQGEEGFNITMQPKNGLEIYSSVEIMPEFPGGMKAFQQYLNKNLEYPEKAKRAKKEGVVVVQFVVETNGAISDPRIARHLETSMDSAAWRLIKDMPRWSPASDYGMKVRCKYSLPIAFKIPKPKPIIKDNLTLDSLAMDSTMLRGGLLVDSLKTDSTNTLSKNNLQQNIRLTDDTLSNKVDTLFVPSDSLQQDTTHMLPDNGETTVKAKKRNVFVRFFRWLFGIEHRQRKRAEKAQLLNEHADSIKAVTTLPADSLKTVPDDVSNKEMEKGLKKTLKEVPEKSLEISSDSIKLTTDSINIDAKRLKRKAKSLTRK